MGKSGLRGDPSEFAMPTVELILLFVPGKHFVLVLFVLLSREREAKTLGRGGGCFIPVVKTELMDGRGIKG